MEQGNILRYKISPITQYEATYQADAGAIARTESDKSPNTKPRPSTPITIPEKAESSGPLARTPSVEQLKRLRSFASAAAVSPKQSVKEEEEERLKQLESRIQTAGVGSDAFGVREFLTSVLHRNVFELFFSLISSTIGKCSYLSERLAHQRRTRQLLHNVHEERERREREKGEREREEERESTWTSEHPLAPEHIFEYSGQEAVVKMIRHYLASPGEMPSDTKPEVKRKLQEFTEKVTKAYTLCVAKNPGQSYWEMRMPPRGDLVKFRVILDPRIARDEMTQQYGQILKDCMDIMENDWITLTVSERLAVVQTLKSIGGAGEMILKATYCPSPLHNFPCLLVAAPGSGRSTTIVKALEEAKRLPPGASQDEGQMQQLVFDGIVAGATFLRFVGCSTCSNDGQSLLRSLVIEMRSVLQPDSCLAHTIPSNQEELVQEVLHCLRLATVECPIIVVIDGLEKLPEADPIRQLLWMPHQVSLYSRLIIGVSPAFCSSRILSLFLPVNVLHLEDCTDFEMQHFILGCHGLSAAHKKAIGEFAERMPTNHLTLISILCQHLIHLSHASQGDSGASRAQTSLREDVHGSRKQPGDVHGIVKQMQEHHRVILGDPVAPLPLRIGHDGVIALNEEALSAGAQQMLCMLAMSRHGFSHAVLRQACALLTEITDDVDEGSAHAPLWERSGVPWDVTFDMEMQHIRFFTCPVVHGRSIVLTLADPILLRAVCATNFFAESQQHVCCALISVLSNEESMGVPKYQILAELPHLQMRMAILTSQLPEHGPASLRETLCSSSFLKGKIEAGLWEDCLKDFRSALRMFESTRFESDTSNSKLLEMHVVRIVTDLTSISHLLVKPFHAPTICQLPSLNSERDGRASTTPTPPSQDVRLDAVRTGDRRLAYAPDAQGLGWAKTSSSSTALHSSKVVDSHDLPRDLHPYFTQVDNQNGTLITCTALVPICDTVTCCSVSSSNAARVALGLEDGHVVLWDAALNEWQDRWKGHQAPIRAISFVPQSVETSGSGKSGKCRGEAHVTSILLTCTTAEVAGWTHAVGHGVGCTGQLLFRYNVACDTTTVADMTLKCSSESEKEYYETMARCTKCSLLHRILAPGSHAKSIIQWAAAPTRTATGRAAEAGSGGDTGAKHANASQHVDASAPVTPESTPQASPSQDRITCLAASNVSGQAYPPGAGTGSGHAAREPSCLVAFGTENGTIRVMTYLDRTLAPPHTSEGLRVPPVTQAGLLLQHPLIKAHTARVNHLTFRRGAAADGRQREEFFASREEFFASASSDGTMRVWRCQLRTSADTAAAPPPSAECIYLLTCTQEMREVLWCALDKTVIYASGRGFMHEWSFASNEAPNDAQPWPACLQGAASLRAWSRVDMTPDPGGTDVRNLTIEKCCLMRSRAPPHAATEQDNATESVKYEAPVVLAFSELIVVSWDAESGQSEQLQVSSKFVDAASSEDTTLSVSIFDGLMRVWQKQAGAPGLLRTSSDDSATSDHVQHHVRPASKQGIHAFLDKTMKAHILKSSRYSNCI